MAEEEVERALRQPVRGQSFQVFPYLCENAEGTSQAANVFGPLVDEGNDPTVMMLLAHDREEIYAGKSFTQCDRIKESNCIFLSQYIELLRRMRHFRLLDSCENNVDKKFVDIRPYVLLLRRLSSKLESVSPQNHYTADRICTYRDPSSIKNHLHLCPYEFLKNLGTDLLNSKLILELEDPSDDMGLYVTQDPDMYTDNLELVIDMLHR